jgi:hypothetical protein
MGHPRVNNTLFGDEMGQLREKVGGFELKLKYPQLRM